MPYFKAKLHQIRCFSRCNFNNQAAARPDGRYNTRPTRIIKDCYYIFYVGTGQTDTIALIQLYLIIYQPSGPV